MGLSIGAPSGIRQKIIVGLSKGKLQTTVEYSQTSFIEFDALVKEISCLLWIYQKTFILEIDNFPIRRFKHCFLAQLFLNSNNWLPSPGQELHANLIRDVVNNRYSLKTGKKWDTQAFIFHNFYIGFSMILKFASKVHRYNTNISKIS